MPSKTIFPERLVRTIELPRNEKGIPQRVPEYFGQNVFSQKVMQKRLSPADCGAIEKIVSHGGKVDEALAGRLATAIKDWAIEQGVTHYCHWFQPQTGSTAEKHDAFLDFDAKGEAVEKFGAWSLMQGEPDASSFPSGGIRSTFEARGYTGWDPTSPVFILDSENGKTLYVPCVFIGYHGESLDFKTPLLRSLESIKKQTLRLMGLLGEDTSKLGIVVNVGPEQEFFVIDKQLAKLRPDLRIAGRSVIGRSPSKTQELEDHYFASIPSRVQAMLNELELELYKVGVPLKTRHNEVAPCQFEVAPVYEACNVAIDHNQLLMNLLKVVGDRHGFQVLLHEKPFAGVNGSGKHVNWSVADTNGRNFLDPGKTPHDNIAFLTFLSAVLKGITDNEATLRASIASYGNDYRLGANEAPPAIISAFLGETLSKILDGLESGKSTNVSAERALLDLGVGALQTLRKDNTDRNRTSPFAFTGNKFEFRAVGSSAPIGYPVAVLNAAVASGLKNLSDRLEKLASGGKVSEEKVLGVLGEIARETKKIRFEGDGYSEDWVKEAASRGLSQNVNTPSALTALADPKKTAFLVEQGVFSEVDLKSRVAIQAERYIKHQMIEFRVAIEMVETGVLPASMDYLGGLSATAASLKDLGTVNPALDQARQVAELVNGLAAALRNFKTSIDKVMAPGALDEHHLLATSAKIAEEVLPRYAALRAATDTLEAVLPANVYPFPNYGDLLYGGY
jgi:glutamine synthetase